MTEAGRRHAIFLTCTALAVSVDQAAKWAVTSILQPPGTIELTPFLNIVLGRNTGIGFGILGEILADRQMLLVFIKLAVLAILFVWFRRSENAIEVAGLGLLTGGALGNVADRWRQGGVTDFVDLHWSEWHWPAFNFADVAILTGVLLVLLAGLWPGPVRLPVDGSAARGTAQ